MDPRCYELNGYPEHSAVDPNYCIFNYQPFDNLIEELRFSRIFAELNGQLGNGANYHLEALWSQAIMPNRPFGNGDPARTDRRENSTWRLAGSVEGSFDGLGGRETYYDLGLSYSSADGNVGIPAILTERLFLAFRGYGGPDCGVGVVPDTSLAPGMRVEDTPAAPGTGGCQYYNPFSSASQFSSLPGAPYYDTPNPQYDPVQANSPELFEWMNSNSNLQSETELLVADVTLSGSWLQDVSGYAAGYQFRRFNARGMPNRHGNLSINPCGALGDTSCLSGNFGPFTFINAYNAYDEDQTVHRLFAEFAIRFGDRLDAQVGAWIPVDIYGDSSLEPEQAFTYNLGVVFLFDSGLEMTLDYWSYDFDDVIGSIPHDTIDELYADPATRQDVEHYIYCADGRADTLANPCGSRSITRVEVPLVNWPGIETSGIDWQARGSFGFGAGTLSAGLSGTYTFDYDVKALSLNGVPIQSFVEAAGRLNFGNPLLVSIPNWKAQAFASYGWNEFGLTAYVNHVSSYQDDGAHDGYGGVPAGSFKVDSFTTLDVTFQWRTPWPGLNLPLSALNLTDEAPPFANVEHAYDGMTHNPKGRRMKLALRYRPGN